MAKQLSKSGIRDGVLARAYHVTQSIDALTGIDDYDITISGSLTLTGSTNINGLVTATSFSGDGSNITGVTGEWDGTLNGNAIITGSLLLTQNLTASNVSSSGDIIGNNINASGNITGNNLSGTNTGDQNISNLAVTGSDVIFANITSSGNLSASGDLSIQGFSSVSASLASAGQSGVSFPYTGSAIISGSLIVTGSTGLLNPDETITLRNTSGSTFRAFGADGPGVFLDINQNDTGLGNTSLMFGNINPNIGAVLPITGLLANYITGSDGVSGSVSFFTGQRDFTAIGGQIHTLISMEYEPGKLLVNNDPEITFKVGEADTNSYRESIDGRYINRNTGETAQLTIGETDSSNAQQVNIKNVIVGTSGSYEIFTTNKSPNNTTFKQGMISGSGETGLSYFGLNYNEYTSTTSSLDLKIGDQGFNNKGPRFEYTYAKNSNNFNDQSTLIKLGHDTSYGGTININEYRNNATASIAGFFTGSAGYTNQKAGAVPFVLFNDIAGVRNSTSPAFVIEQTFPATGSTPNPTFRVDHNGSISKVGAITSTGTISTTTGFKKSAAGDVLLNSNDLPILSHDNSGTPIVTTIGSDDIGGSNLSQVQIMTDTGEVLAVSGSTVTVGPSAATHGTEALNIRGNVSSSGFGLFQAGKPIVTHTLDLSASLANAGRYHIVGGNLTCHLTTSTAPIGAEYEFFQTSSAGQFLFETGSGVTLISKNNSIRLAQLGSSAVLKKVSVSTFHLMGDLT